MKISGFFLIFICSVNDNINQNRLINGLPNTRNSMIITAQSVWRIANPYAKYFQNVSSMIGIHEHAGIPINLFKIEI